jgi:hypothetical protein
MELRERDGNVVTVVDMTGHMISSLNLAAAHINLADDVIELVKQGKWELPGDFQYNIRALIARMQLERKL